VAGVGVVEVAAGPVVDVAAVRDGRVAAGWPVLVRPRVGRAGVPGGAGVGVGLAYGKGVVVDVAGVDMVQVAVVQGIAVAIVQDLAVAAAGAVLVGVAGMGLAIHGASSGAVWT
jgi:hypothetical protein